MNPLRALIILFISILFSFVNCDSDYVIGSSYTLTWSAADINATTVDIILYYGGNLTSNWTLATNVDNKGHYNVDVNLTGTLIQFNIPNYSPGQFRLRYKNVSENTIYYNITEKLTVLQPVVLLNLIHGRATPNAEIIDAYINVSTFLYNQLNFIQFYAEYITLNGDTWTSNCVLNVTLIGTSSPTPSPTFAPTTRAPTTSAPTPSPTTPSPTPNPSSPPTSRPSLSPTARPTDKPTPSPTVKPSSQPTPSPTPVPVTTTAHPSLQPSSQPTAKPTEHPTPSPSLRPTPRPTEKPTPSPTPVPVTTTAQPSLQPSSQPTARPTEKPTPSPTPVPVTTTAQPSPNPTPSPTIRPTERPTLAPVPTTAQPTFSPSPQPTSRPTKDPTTASPTKAPTTASPTKDPTTHSPTKYPTASPTGDPTTASPTTANPTPGPTPIPTLPTPSPTLPTPSPTLPTSAPISSGQVSKRKLLSGSSFSIVETPGYTLVYVQIAIPATCGAGGPYFVSVGVRNESEPEDYQYYTINAIDDRNNEQYQFISYNPSKLNLSVQVGNKTLPGNSTSGLALYNFSQYQDAKLSFEIDSEISQFDYYVVLFNIESEEQYVLACQSQRLSEFSTFGWKASTLNSSSDSFPPAGEYYLQIFWSANQEWSIIKPNSDLYQLNPLKPIKFIILDDVIYPAVSIVKSDEKVTYSTGSQSVKFRTSFNYSTLLHVYVEQCYSNSSSLNCTSYKSEETNFTYTENEQQTDIHIPKNLITSSSDKTNLTTRLHVYTKNCYGDSILDTVIFINVTSNESKKNNSSLSPGAIVGIICAGLLVVGLIAWWLCMRKPAEETYRKLDA